MNTVQKAWQGVVSGLKAFTMRFTSGARSWYYGTGLGRTQRDYVSAVGDGTGNAIVVACVDWLSRTFLEAPLRVRRYNGDDLDEEPRHPLLKLMRRPNPFYSGRTMMQAFLADRVLTGNAYLVKVRSGAGIPVQLWWVPSWMMEPRWPDDGSVFISHYEYTVNGTPYRLETRDVYHSRHGLDPHNPRKGRSRLASLVRDIFTDDEAATFSAAVLANMGVLGVIISPADKDTVIEPEQAQQIKGELEPKITGDNRGRTLVLSANVKVDQPSMSPESMNLRMMRQVPEERVSAVLGTPAVLVGLGAGLEHSIYNNYSEAREAAFEEHIIPLGKDLAEEMMLQLMPDFDDPDDVELDFDTREVRVLQEDMNAKYARMVTATGGPIMDVSEARQQVGLDALPTAFWWQPSKVTPTPVEDLMSPPEPPAPVLPPPVVPVPEDEDEPTDDDDEALAGKVRSNGHHKEAVAA